MRICNPAILLEVKTPPRESVGERGSRNAQLAEQEGRAGREDSMIHRFVPARGKRLSNRFQSPRSGRYWVVTKRIRRCCYNRNTVVDWRMNANPFDWTAGIDLKCVCGRGDLRIIGLGKDFFCGSTATVDGEISICNPEGNPLGSQDTTTGEHTLGA